MKKITPSAPAERPDNPSNRPPSFGPRPETLALLSWFARIYTPDNAPRPPHRQLTPASLIPIYSAQ